MVGGVEVLAGFRVLTGSTVCFSVLTVVMTEVMTEVCGAGPGGAARRESGGCSCAVAHLSDGYRAGPPAVSDVVGLAGPGVDPAAGVGDQVPAWGFGVLGFREVSDVAARAPAEPLPRPAAQVDRGHSPTRPGFVSVRVGRSGRNQQTGAAFRDDRRSWAQRASRERDVSAGSAADRG